MEPSSSLHPWAVAYAEYEAVLSSVNELPPWDSGATARCFQTFDWDDVTMQGEDVLTLKHQHTGAVVLYDGGVLAIAETHDRLRQAAGDLVSVLFDLGWRRADVYHPRETMSGFLQEFGRAIPGNMDFEANAAQLISDVRLLPEAAMLVEHGNGLLGGLGLSDDENKVVLGEWQSMDANATRNVASSGLGAGSLAGMQLEDEVPGAREGLDGPALAQVSLAHDGEGPQFREATGVEAGEIAPAALEASELAAAGVLREGPTNLGDTGAVAPLEAGLLLENEGLRDANLELRRRLVSVEQSSAAKERAHADAAIRAQSDANAQALREDELGIECQRLREELDIAQAKLASVAPMGEIDTWPSQTDDGLTGVEVPTVTAQHNICTVGLTSFVFDVPGARMSAGSVDEVGRSLGGVDAVHLYPGRAGQPVRWDVLAEVADEQPWFLESLLAGMGFTRAEVVPVGALALQVGKATKGRPQLRDWVAAGEKRGGASQAISRVLGALMLCGNGRAFVDVRSAPEAGESTVLLVRSEVESKVPKLFVVHVEERDGPFALWVGDLLRFVVYSYATSVRAH